MGMLFFARCVDKGLFLLVGYALVATGLFLVGPSRLLHLPDSLSLMQAGMFVIGVGKAPLASFATTYAMEKAGQCFPEQMEGVKVHISVFTILAPSLGGLSMPLLSSLLYTGIGFARTTDILALCLSCVSVLFLLHYITDKKAQSFSPSLKVPLLNNS